MDFQTVLKEAVRSNVVELQMRALYVCSAQYGQRHLLRCYLTQLCHVGTVLFMPDIITVFSRRQFLWLCRVVAVHAEGQSRSFI